jgi:hypothetical protein
MRRDPAFGTRGAPSSTCLRQAAMTALENEADTSGALMPGGNGQMLKRGGRNQDHFRSFGFRPPSGWVVGGGQHESSFTQVGEESGSPLFQLGELSS